jgi:hypothetical protein
VSHDLTEGEVYSSVEYGEYRLIFDEHEAFYYAESAIIARREREQIATSPPPFQEWYRQYLRTAAWRERADAAKARFGVAARSAIPSTDSWRITELISESGTSCPTI